MNCTQIILMLYNSEKDIFMRVDNIHSGPNFGMAIKIFDPHTADKLKRRLASEKNANEFKRLFDSQKNNEFNISLTYIYDKNNCGKLRGCVYNGRDFYKEYKQSTFSAKFQNPLKFIKKMCDEADKIFSDKNSKLNKII